MLSEMLGKLSQSEKQVLYMLKAGEKQAIPSIRIQSKLGLNRRQVCSHIEAMRNAGFPIGATRKAKGGYYLMDSEEEKRRTASVMRSQGWEMIETAATLNNAPLAHELGLGGDYN